MAAPGEERSLRVHLRPFVYLKKAKGVLVSTCNVDPKTLIPGETDVEVKITDTSRAVVLQTKINFYISRKPVFQVEKCLANK